MKANFWSKGELNKWQVEELCEIQKIIIAACSKETSADPEKWTEDNPLYGHCAIIAILLHIPDRGNILRASLESVKGYEQMRSHYWNMLPDGSEIDLSSGQFKGDDRNLVPAGEKTKDGEPITAKGLLKNKMTLKRFEIFVKRITQVLKRSQSGCSNCKNCSKKKCKGD